MRAKPFPPSRVAKETLDRWLWPDVLRNQDTSVIKAKQAISSYKKAVGDPVGLAELMVFYCECAAGFCNVARLDKIRTLSHNFGYGVGDDMDSQLAK